MRYSRAEAIEAIRQHPELASEMALTPSELEILGKYEIVTSAELESSYSSRSNASRFMSRLIAKGYFKRVKSGVFEKIGVAQ